jgi:glutathione S-transferase
MPSDTPVLWQLRFSHYNEKARWALDFKGIPHIRRSALPGMHPLRAKRLYGGDTLPVLILGDRTIPDSTAIIAALEERHPEPALYPAQEDDRRRALELEDRFDEELGAQIRRAFFHDLLPDARLSARIFSTGFGRSTRLFYRTLLPVLRPAVRHAMAIDPAGAAEGYARVLDALDRIESALTPSGFLVGESFSVADLTAAALMAPLVRPPEFGYRLPDRWTDPIEEFRDSIKDRTGFHWVQETYREHRGHSAAIGE